MIEKGVDDIVLIAYDSSQQGRKQALKTQNIQTFGATK